MEKQMISKYISYQEATYTSHKYANTPNGGQLANMQYLAVMILDKVREHFNAPIRINSMFRSPAVNEAIRGAKNSQHMANSGAAADIGNCGGDLMKVFEYIKDNLEVDQMIIEAADSATHPTRMGWLHVSLKKSGNRKEILIMKDGKYYPWQK